MFLSITAVLLLTLLLGLLGVLWFLTRRSRPPVKLPSTSTTSQRSSISTNSTVTPSTNGIPPGHPKLDPIHQFADGKREDVPFTCPFMAAFKEAKKKEEGGGQEEEAGSSPGQVVLEQFTDMMAGYEEFKRNKELEAAKSDEGESA